MKLSNYEFVLNVIFMICLVGWIPLVCIIEGIKDIVKEINKGKKGDKF